MNFQSAFEIIMSHEGGYVNDPRDPGGETKFGISKRAYPNLDIKNLTLSQAREIYERDYWNACQCNDFPQRARLILFDCAVNQGVKTAIVIYQQSLGVTADGVIGPITIAAAYQKNNDETYQRFLTERAIRYVNNANFPVYGKGWISRVFDISLKNLA